MPTRLGATVLLGLSMLACSDRTVESAAGQPGTACRVDGDPCDVGSLCSEAGICYDQASPCDDYDCGAGTCTVIEDMPACQCPAGTIHASPAAPCRESNPPVPPSPGQAGGFCRIPGNVCDDGMVCNREPFYCFVPEDPCAGFSCGGQDRGRCEVDQELPSCQCFEGFSNEMFDLYCCPILGGDPLCD